LKKRIIIANDVKLTLELESSFLQREGFAVHAAGNGREALELARKVQPDLLLLDYDMPLLSGVEVCAAVRADPSMEHLPVLIVSDSDSTQARERCRKAGCTGFVSRSEGAEQLLRAVAETLRVGVRRRQRVAVKIQVQAGSHYMNFKGEARDLSSSGLRFESPEPIDTDLPVVVQFKLPGSKKNITATVRVTRCSPCDDDRFLVAAQFDSIDAEARQQIERFLQDTHATQTITLRREP
jgi:CheY-like chemotaxis protein